MKLTFLIIFTIYFGALANAQLIVSEIGTLPERVSNNAVCEGFINEAPYLFSFSGIDSTRVFSGIHLKSYRINLETGESERIADLPDEMGKIAAGASRIGNTIYIAGGYNVFANNSEKSTNKMHRYDIQSNQYLTDAKDIPVPTDDHVQAVWRDSLIYLITGWNDTANIPNVQIYNPVNDEWTMGTSVPNLDTYKSFGASGMILGDTIYYFGGARSTGNFGIQNKLRIGIINPENPTDIEWSISTPDLLTNGYRMAAASVNNELHWIGGSNKTYNYNGIAYDGSGIVPPNKRDLYLTPDELEWNQTSPIDIPMDLRGIANVSETIKYIAGGMIDNREVTNKVYKLEWLPPSSLEENLKIDIVSGPNPFEDRLTIHLGLEYNLIDKIECFDVNGQSIKIINPEDRQLEIDTSSWAAGTYFLRIKIGQEYITKKVTKV